MLIVPLVLVGMLVFSILHRAWVRRQAFELRMQILEVATLTIRRGQSLASVFRKLAQEHGRGHSRRLTKMARELDHGEDLAEALQWGAPESFPPDVLAVIREVDGTAELPAVLESLKEQTDDRLAVQHRVALGLLYPLALMLAVLFTQDVLLTSGAIRNFVEPMWGISVQDWVGYMPRGIRVSAWMFFTCSLLLSILLVHYAWRSAPVLRRLFGFVGSHLPFRSVAGRYRAAGQFLTTLSHLVAAGLSLPVAMRRAVGASGSAKLEKGVLRTAAAIEDGECPNDAWRHSGLPAFAVATVVATTRSAPARLVDGLRRAGVECRERYVTKRERFMDMLHPIGVVVFGTMLAINMHKVFVISDYWAEANGLW